jgi:hypothetical protein
MQSNVFSLSKTIQRPQRTKQYFSTWIVVLGSSTVGRWTLEEQPRRRRTLAERRRRRPPLAEQPRRRPPSRRPTPPTSAPCRATLPPSLPRVATPPPSVPSKASPSLTSTRLSKFGAASHSASPSPPPVPTGESRVPPSFSPVLCSRFSHSW